MEKNSNGPSIEDHDTQMWCVRQYQDRRSGDPVTLRSRSRWKERREPDQSAECEEDDLFPVGHTMSSERPLKSSVSCDFAGGRMCQTSSNAEAKSLEEIVLSDVGDHKGVVHYAARLRDSFVYGVR
ncbi:hypothetical protein quinque_014185 [Culex quinquefasciatus]